MPGVKRRRPRSVAPSGHPALRVRERIAGLAGCTSVYVRQGACIVHAPPTGLLLSSAIPASLRRPASGSCPRRSRARAALQRSSRKPRSPCMRSPRPAGDPRAARIVRADAKDKAGQERTAGQERGSLATVAAACASASARRSAPLFMGPRESRPAGGGSVRRIAHTMCASSLNAQGRASNEPRSPRAKSKGRMPVDRDVRGGFSLVTFSWPFKRK